MANRTKRENKSKGRYATYDEFVAAVMLLHRGRKHSLRAIAEEVGTTKATVAGVIDKHDVKELDVDLNAMLDKLWRVVK